MEASLNKYGTYLPWNSFKNLLDAQHPFREIPLPGSIRLIVNDAGAKFQTVIHTDGNMPAEYQDYQNNYESNKNKSFIPIDPEGSHINRGKAAPKGWHFEPQCIEVTTATTNGFYNKDKNGNDLGHVTYKMYKSDGTETTNPSLATKTEITWNPDYGYEIIAGNLFQPSAPMEDIYLWVEGPSSTFFLQGGINLKLIGTSGKVSSDGRTSKRLYDELEGSPVPNHLIVTVKHPLAFQHTFQLKFDLFRA